MQASSLWGALAVLVLGAASVRGNVDVSTYCTDKSVTDEGFYCATCMHSVYCAGSSDPTETTLLETCHPGEVCDGDLMHTSCIPISEAATCQCSGVSQCDDYNPVYLTKCNDEGIYDVLDCDGDYTCSVGKCGAVVPGVPSCEEGGYKDSAWHFITPDCTRGFYCYDTGEQFDVECAANEYIDINGDCLPAPPLPCDSGCTGNCPDNTDCTKYYYCDGSPDPDVTQCEDGFFFDPKAEPVPRCIETDETVCAPLTFCDFSGSGVVDPDPDPDPNPDSTTTTTTAIPEPPPCNSDTTGNYPYGPCSSSYWSCRNTGGGDYEYILMECPTDLVFNTDETYPYCDYPVNVDTC